MAKFSVKLAIILVIYYWWSRDTFDPESIREKRVLITGASSGIGEQVAYKYAELGAELLLTARRTELLEKVAAECSRRGAAAVHIFSADMTNSTHRKNLVRQVKTQLKKLDFLILNHAILSYGWWTPTPEYMNTLNDFLNANLVSYVDLTTMLMATLEESGGHIAVLSSVLGKFGVSGWTHYCTSKFALQGYYASLRQELRYRRSKVSVTVVVFGAIGSQQAIQLFRNNLPSFEFEMLAATVEDAAEVLVAGVSARKYEIIYPSVATLLTYLNRFAPQLFEDGNSWFYNQRLK